MDLSWWRDLIIIIWGVVGALAVVVIAILVIMFYQRMRKTLDAAERVIARANDVIDHAESEVVKPLFQFGSLMQGLVQGLDLISNLFGRKEKKNE